MKNNDTKIREKRLIVLICTTLQNGGTELVAYKYFTSIDRNLFDVRLILINKALISIESRYQPEIIELNIKRVILSSRKIVKAIDNLMPAIILSFFDHVNTMLLTLKKMGFIRARLIIRPSTTVSSYKFFYKNTALYNTIKWTYKLADEIYCQSIAIKNEMNELGISSASKLRVVYNPIDFDKVDKLSKMPSNILLEKGEIKLITLANLRSEKGYLRILNALSSIVNIDYHYYIIGDGDYKNRILEEIGKLKLSEKVTLLGNINEPYSVLTKADYFILGSHFEGYPNAVVEAMVLNIPVIGYNDCLSLKEIVTERKTGLFINSEKNNLQDCILIARDIRFDKMNFDEIRNKHSLEKFRLHLNFLLQESLSVISK